MQSHVKRGLLVILILQSMFLFGCKGRREIQKAQLVGIWKIDKEIFKSPELVVGDFSETVFNLRDDGTFSVEGLPKGVFLNEKIGLASLEGTWVKRYQDGENYLRFRITNLPNVASGTFGALVYSWHKKVLFEISGPEGEIYVSRKV